MNKPGSYIDEGPEGYLKKSPLHPRVINDVMVAAEGAVGVQRGHLIQPGNSLEGSERKGCLSLFVKKA